jgi:hypothetical protein
MFLHYEAYSLALTEYILTWILKKYDGRTLRYILEIKISLITTHVIYAISSYFQGG